MIYRLVFLTGAATGLRRTVEPAPMAIGTDEDCDIRVDDSEMARRHAAIEQKPDGLWINDLGSMNRILINGRELRQSQLKHGDVVELGRTRLLVQAAVQAEYDGPTATPVTPGRRSRRLAPLLGLLVLTTVAGWWISRRAARDPSPDTGHPPPVAGNLHPVVTQIVEIAGAVTNVTLVTNVVVETATVARAMSPAESEEFLTMLRELQGLKAMVTSMAATVRIGDSVTSAPAEIVSLGSGSMEPAPMEPVTKPVVEELVPREVRARVASVEQQRFPSSDDYDEMRILRIGLAWRPEEAPDPADRVSLVIAFFEQDPAGSGAVPSRVTPPRRFEIPRNAWLEGTSTVVTATYVIPKGMLASDNAAEKVGGFHGYLVRVCRGGEILDAYARPRALLHAEMTALE